MLRIKGVTLQRTRGVTFVRTRGVNATVFCRLDYAFSIHKESPTLKDFRASQDLIDLENEALTKARKIISPHSEIAEIFKNKIKRLEWNLPDIKPALRKGNKILFPASAIGRKGAYEIKSLAQDLNFNLTVSRRVLEGDNFWQGITTDQFNGDYREVGLIVYPTYVENQPRQILKAVANGIPVITTKACGIDSFNNVNVFEIEDLEEIKNEIKKVLGRTATKVEPSTSLHP